MCLKNVCMLTLLLKESFKCLPHRASPNQSDSSVAGYVVEFSAFMDHCFQITVVHRLTFTSQTNLAMPNYQKDQGKGADLTQK